MSQAEIGRVRLLWTEVGKDITSVLFSVYKFNVKEFSDWVQMVEAFTDVA